MLWRFLYIHGCYALIKRFDQLLHIDTLSVFRAWVLIFLLPASSSDSIDVLLSESDYKNFRNFGVKNVAALLINSYRYCIVSALFCD
jgi:hypothetical protein